MSKQPEKKERTPGSGNNQVRAQYAPFYKVLSAGTCIEWTDRLSEASAAFKDAAVPKHIWRINGRDVSLVNYTPAVA